VHPTHLKESIRHLRDQYGVRTILNLRFPGDLSPIYRDEYPDFYPKDHQNKEKQAVTELNNELSKKAAPKKQIKYVNVEVEGGKALTDKNLKAILPVLKEASPEKPLFVHCKVGRDRTGEVAALYRILKNPETPFEVVFEEMKSCGHNPLVWSNYIGNLKHHLSTHPEFRDYYARNRQTIDRLEQEVYQAVRQAKQANV
jgi:hypothetical protein